MILGLVIALIVFAGGIALSFSGEGLWRTSSPQKALFYDCSYEIAFQLSAHSLAEYLLYKVGESVRAKQMEQCGESWDRR